MEFTRRELLKLGGVGAAAVAARGPGVLLPADGSQAAAAPIDEKYLRHGLDLLCSAHAGDAFFGGHAGGAVISAYYLCREEELEAGSAEVIRATLDRHYAITKSPFPDEEPAKDGVAELLRSLEPDVDGLTREGHNVIFLSLALRAMHDLPKAATPARIDGLRRTVRALEPKVAGKGGLDVPESSAAFSEFVLAEFLGSTEGGPGQGFSGHLLTHGRAIVDLRRLGHEAFASKCLNAYQLAVRRARPRPPGSDYRAARAKVDFIRPDRKEYWKRRAAAETLEIGHLFKYPYGFLGLRRESKNSALNDVCWDNCYRLFKC